VASDARISRQSLRRYCHAPVREFVANRSPPFGEPGFSVVDFLSAANQRNQHSPVSVSVHDGEHGFWLRDFLSCLLRVLSGIPSPLGFVEDDNALRRRFIGLVRCFTNERMDVLDEGADRPLCAFES